jgi:hypothetical protein
MHHEIIVLFVDITSLRNGIILSLFASQPLLNLLQLLSALYGVNGQRHELLKRWQSFVPEVDSTTATSFSTTSKSEVAFAVAKGHEYKPSFKQTIDEKGLKLGFICLLTFFA